MPLSEGTKTGITIVAGVLLVGGGIAAGIYFYNKDKNKKEIESSGIGAGSGGGGSSSGKTLQQQKEETIKVVAGRGIDGIRFA
jgi:hypothetical protein